MLCNTQTKNKLTKFVLLECPPSLEARESDLEKTYSQHSRDEQFEEAPVLESNPSRNRVPCPIFVCFIIGILFYTIILTWRPQSSSTNHPLGAEQLDRAGDPTKVSSYPDTSIAPVILHWVQQSDRSDPPADSCRVRVHFTPNRTAAEGVIWPQRMPEPAPNGIKQKNAFWSLENSIYYPAVAEARESIRKGEGILDYEMTYRLGSDVPLSYDYWFIDLRMPAKPFSERKTDKLIAVFISNCYAKNNRLKVLKKMMELMPGQIDSFGYCKNNADIHQELATLEAQSGGALNVSDLNRWARKMTVIRNYKFTIAFENANEEE